MGVIRWREKLHNKWISLSIKKKIVVFTKVVFLIIFLSVLFDAWIVDFSLNDFKVIMDDNVKSSDFVDAIEEETRWFNTYIKNPNEENKKEMEFAFEQTRQVVISLPYDYQSMSIERYAKTWSIKNSYENYINKRDQVLNISEKNHGYIKELYQVYDMQEYLQGYARILMRYTLEDGNAVYEKKVNSLRLIPYAVLAIGVVLFGVMISLAKVMNKTITLPIMNLVRAAKKIASNDFSGEDVSVENQDEMGELVKAFNIMKDSTGQYINALEEKRKMVDLLHKEELEKIEIEKHLEAAKFEILKSQINPHFLFNALNVIGGMAKLESAETSEKMIKALSTIFRYNLKTPQNEVLLAQELRVVSDYMYLQQMRFGSRIKYNIECNVDMDSVLVPTFTFQPLVENAILHGISKKEEGGNITIRIWQELQNIIITVADTGVGIPEEELDYLRGELKKGNSERIGIGLGNIYKRVNGMYRNSEVNILSRKDAGTVIKLVIPLKKWEG